MEKDVLNRLRHPNIIRLYQTFQDDNNLYFLLELLDGGELLTHLLHEGRQLPLDEDLARFYLADIVNAVEYMHSNQVLHRDLKPENMVVCKDSGGHLKLIDFGTAKNFADTALNGPNFVGTPEYMPPETIDNKEPTFASDMWAFGCIVYQLLTGETPFSGGSAYLTFLRVQDGNYYLPEYLSDAAKDLVSKLLQKDANTRLGGTQANAMSAVKVAHPFFKGIDFENHMQAKQPTSHLCGSELLPLVKSLANLEKTRDKNHPLDFTSELGQAAAVAEGDNRGGSIWEAESTSFLEAIEVINSQRPAFVVFCGDFVNAKPSQEFYSAQVAAFQELLNLICPQVRLIFAAGSGEFENQEELTKYEEKFGDAQFSFWWVHNRCARHAPTCLTDSWYFAGSEESSVCLIVSGGSTANTVANVVTKAAEEADEYKCEVVTCKAPWGGFSSLIYRTEVSQAGVVTKAFHVENASAAVSPAETANTLTKHSSLTPEEECQETVLAAEMVTLNIDSVRKEE
ncbi:unnamed protein product [Phytophthora fragariaefolia]|uniref:Unnamed protein product n=1 Tax=Phytophthora fragariaefolia TaxID=1490495 RepID=A0A9W6TQX6_9STRA|nr:unnamed protein product [Phytophthora fragariaefolia]